MAVKKTEKAPFRKLMVNIAHADKLEVAVGIPESRNARKGGGSQTLRQLATGAPVLTNAYLGAIHEHGTATIPARPFLVPGVKNAQGKILKVLKRGLDQALAGDTNALVTALDLAGQVAADSVKDKIATGPFTPLAPETIRRKGSSKPLIDTGQLRSSISHIVRPKSS